MRFLIAASGSGGHLLPAVFIAKALQELEPTAEIRFVGSGRPLEAKVIDSRGFQRYIVPISGIKGLGIAGALKFLFRMPASVVKVWRILRDFKPDVVIGVGGYVSVFPVLLARLRGIATWIHEAEMHPGMANEFLGRISSKVSLAYMDTRIGTAESRVFTGHPVRPEMKQVTPPTQTAPQHLLILGGSQGALALDRAMINLADEVAKLGLAVQHQSRPDQIEALTSAYDAAGVTAKVFSFTDDMVAAYSWSDLIVARSGAGSVLEVGVSGRPAIFVPLPNSQGDHQIRNAESLSKTGRAVVVLEGDGFEKRLFNAVKECVAQKRYREMVDSIWPERPLEAARAIAEGIVALARKD